MKKSPPPSTTQDEPILEFPVEPDFVSKPPQIEPQAMLQRIAETMALRKNRPGEAERRAAEKIDVEFVL
jgi:hypothetical protein